jgi:hypothetical protein
MKSSLLRALLLSASLLVSACMQSHVGTNINAAALTNAGSGVVVMYTPITRGWGCHTGSVILATYDAATGGYRGAERVNFQSMGLLGGGLDVSEINVPAGTYGIVELECGTSHQHSSWHSKVISRDGLFSVDSVVYEKALAIFDVKPGEVVNIGSIRPLTTQPGMGWRTGSFVSIIEPLPAEVMARFQAARPDLAAVMVTRLMRPAEAAPGQMLPPPGMAPRAPAAAAAPAGAPAQSAAK